MSRAVVTEAHRRKGRMIANGPFVAEEIAQALAAAAEQARVDEREALRRKAKTWARDPDLDGCCKDIISAFAEEIPTSEAPADEETRTG